MTKNEALKKCIDGAKICHPEWVASCFGDACIEWQQPYFYFNGQVAKGCDMKYEDGWMVHPEYVDFAEAWKAYEAGKCVKSIIGYVYCKKDESCIDGLLINEIRGKWLILEDE